MKGFMIKLAMLKLKQEGHNRVTTAEVFCNLPYKTTKHCVASTLDSFAKQGIVKKTSNKDGAVFWSLPRTECRKVIAFMHDANELWTPYR